MPGVEIVAPPTPKAADMMPVTTPRATVRTSRRRLGSRSLADALDDHGHALTAADAHGLETDVLVERLQVVDEGGHDPGAGHAERVAEGGLELAQLLLGGAGPGPVVLGDGAAVGQRIRSDLPVEEAVLLGLYSAVLGDRRVLVHALAGHAVLVGHVLGREAHGDVHQV